MFITKSDVEDILKNTNFTLKNGYAQINYGYDFLCEIEKKYKGKLWGSYSIDSEDLIINFTLHLSSDNKLIEKRYIYFTIDFSTLEVIDFVHNSIQKATQYKNEAKVLVDEIGEEYFEVVCFDLLPEKFIKDVIEYKDDKEHFAPYYLKHFLVDFERSQIFFLGSEMILKIENDYCVDIPPSKISRIEKTDDYVINYFFKAHFSR